MKLRQILNSKTFKILIIFLILILTFIFFLIPRIDPDTWWHFRLGKEILENHTFANNLTYTCSDYIWTNYSSISEVIFYLINNYFGLAVTYIFVALLAVLSLVISFKTLQDLLKYYKLKFSPIWILIPFLIINMIVLKDFVAVRAQIFSFLFTPITLYLLFKIQHNKAKLKYFIILVISLLAWSNLHGGFIIGLGLIMFFILWNFALLFYEVFSRKDKTVTLQLLNKIKYLFPTLIISILIISLTNPFGFNLWKEVFVNTTLSQNWQYIMEWKSVDIHSAFGLGYLLILLATLLSLMFQKKKNILLFILFGVFTFASMWSVRYIFMSISFITIVLILNCVTIIKQFKLDLDLDFKPLAIISKIGMCLIIITLFLLGIFNALDWNTLMQKPLEDSSYPGKAVQFIKTHEDIANLKIFNDYGWGGYLSYAYPEKKWFINGIMAGWLCKNVTDDYILIEYDHVTTMRSDWMEIIQKNKINAFLLQKGSPLANVLEKIPGWSIVYVDEAAVIIVKVSDKLN